MCDETKERARERRGPKNTPRGRRAEMMMEDTGTEEGCREGKEAGERNEGWRRSEEREGEEGNEGGERKQRRREAVQEKEEGRRQEKAVGKAGVQGEEWKAQRRQQWRRTGGELDMKGKQWVGKRGTMG